EKGGDPLAGAAVQLRNSNTGEAFNAVTSASGRYVIDNVPPGGPFVLTATAEGYQPVIQPDITLALGQRLSVDLVVRAAFVEEIAVVAHLDALGDHARTGPSTTVKSSAIEKLP